ncbi:MAG: protein-export chaperone SecB [Gammaproteobacteria bacterium]
MRKPAAATTADNAAATGNTAAAGIVLQNRYIKDLSFENPGAPASLGAADALSDAPSLAISVEIGGRRRGALHEVVLSVTVTATRRSEILFIAEVRYAGLFEIAGLAQDVRERFIYCEAPRILFPYAERIIADVTRDGGMPALGLSPPDFAAMFRQKYARETEAARAH